MNRVTKINTILTASNSEKIEALCVWIHENSDSVIGWEQMTKQSGLSHAELIKIFQLYKHQTPMAYVRQVRQQKKNSEPTHPQHPLFLQKDNLANNQD